jgi:hypothetical protein
MTIKNLIAHFWDFWKNVLILWERYHVSGKFLGVSGKFFSYLGKIGVCPEKIFDSQNGTLTENVLATGGEGRRSGAKGGQKWPIDGGPPAVALSVPFCDEKCPFCTSHRYLIYCSLDSASLLVKLKPRIFQRLPPFE